MPISLIFDCGATSLRTIAINQAGTKVAAHHLNNTQPDVESPEFHIWDIEEIWSKLMTCAKQTLSQLSEQQRQSCWDFSNHLWRGRCII